jgi:hypothetical protein
LLPIGANAVAAVAVVVVFASNSRYLSGISPNGVTTEKYKYPHKKKGGREGGGSKREK